MQESNEEIRDQKEVGKSRASARGTVPYRPSSRYTIFFIVIFLAVIVSLLLFTFIAVLNIHGIRATCILIATCV